jgi:DNA-binding MarR family transcriptional regulator
MRGLAAVANRDLQRLHIERIIERAGVELTPTAASLLVRLDQNPGAQPEALGRARGIGPDEVRSAMADLRGRGLIIEEPGDGRGPRWTLTRRGCEVLTKLVAARRAHLAELFADWGPARREEVASLLRRLADELVPDVQTKAPA